MYTTYTSTRPKQCFSLFQNNTKKVDLDYFKELCIDYYRSDDISALGNFITGKLDFNDWSIEKKMTEWLHC